MFSFLELKRPLVTGNVRERRKEFLVLPNRAEQSIYQIKSAGRP
jgi:hypothetical protein